MGDLSAANVLLGKRRVNSVCHMALVGKISHQGKTLHQSATMRDTDPSLLRILRKIERESGELKRMAKRLPRLGLASLRFTPDGILVGDVGKMMAAQHFDLTITRERKGHNAVTTLGGVRRYVRIISRRSTFDLDFAYTPDLLLVIVFSDNWSQWQVAYNGDPSEPIERELRRRGFTVDHAGRVTRNGLAVRTQLPLDWLRELPRPKSVIPKRKLPLELFDGSC